jgi:Cu+-exporting ATPase
MALESANAHPFAEAIVDHCIARSAEKLTVTDFMQTPGAGVAGRVSAFGKSFIVIIGSPESVAHSTTALDPILIEAIARAKSRGDSAALLAVDGVAIALFIAGDEVRADARETIAALSNSGISSWLVTGDHLESAEKIAVQVGITADRIIAGVSPEGKIEKVRQLQESGLRVLAVGDGINDAAALAQADLSIAMGTGTDTAIATADITLMRPELMGAVESLVLSRKTLRTIKVNLGWAFSYNAIGIPIAAMGLMSPMYAAGAMALSSLFVVTNSLRIR